MTTTRKRKKLNVTLAPETHAILDKQESKAVAIDTAVQSYFRPVVVGGVWGEREKNK